MKKIILLSSIVTIALISCTEPKKRAYESLDRSIELQDHYDRKHTDLKDSLITVFMSAETGSAQWNAANQIEEITAYHNIDTCYHYIMHMMALCGDDEYKSQTSKACYANILYKMDSLVKAREVLESIDTAKLNIKALRRYCNAAYHIYGQLGEDDSKMAKAKEDIIELWWHKDSSNIQCAYYHHVFQRDRKTRTGIFDPWADCILESPNDSAKAYYFSGKEYMIAGETDKAMLYLAQSAECDMRLSVKTYNALYQLAGILFQTGDIKHADKYMRITLEDAYISNFKIRYDDVIKSELEIMNVLLHEQKNRKQAYVMTIISIALLLILAVVTLFVQNRYSTRLSLAKDKLDEVSRIKDGFLAMYMEKCVDYLNNVDDYRSVLRHTVKHGGIESVNAMLRQPSFADGEFNDLLANFDSVFLGVFPDFIDKVNSLMQEGHKLSLTHEGKMSTELRILALIRMGICKRKKIAKVLNMSVTTVYSYHSNLKKYSIYPDSSFDNIITDL